LSRDDSLLILNRGSEAGVSVGDRLTVATEFSSPVQLQATRVFNSISVMNVLPGQGDWSFLAEGDTVTLFQ